MFKASCFLLLACLFSQGFATKCDKDSPCKSDEVCVNEKCTPKHSAEPKQPLPEVTVCPAGWIHGAMFNACYYFVPYAQGQYVYTAARTLCNSLQAKPVSITSPAESFFINNYLGNQPYWVGLINCGGISFWEDGAPLAYFNWRPSQPDNCCPVGQASCTLANYRNSVGQWDDAGCESLWAPNIGVVCKRPVTQT